MARFELCELYFFFIRLPFWLQYCHSLVLALTAIDCVINESFTITRVLLKCGWSVAQEGLTALGSCYQWCPTNHGFHWWDPLLSIVVSRILWQAVILSCFVSLLVALRWTWEFYLLFFVIAVACHNSRNLLLCWIRMALVVSCHFLVLLFCIVVLEYSAVKWGSDVVMAQFHIRSRGSQLWG